MQLLAMDPQVYGKLLTLHQKGNRVDVDALRDRIPLEQDAGKRPQDGISQEQKLVAAENYFGGRFWSFGNIWEFIVQRLGSRESGGVHKPGGRAPLAHALRACAILVSLLTPSPSLLGVFWSKKNHHESFILFGLHLIFLFCKTQKQGKNKNLHWALG